MQLYREVQEAAQRYAMSQGIDLVLHYTDASTQEEYYNAANVVRRMQSPGAIPVYWTTRHRDQHGRGAECRTACTQTTSIPGTPPSN